MMQQNLLEEFRRTLLAISEIPPLPKETLLRLLQRGMIRELLAHPTRESITLLEEICVFAPLPIIRQDALEALIVLSQQNNPEAILSLYRLSVERDFLPAISHLRATHLTCPDSQLQAIFSFLYLPEIDITQSYENLVLLSSYFFYRAQPSTRLKITQSTASPDRQRVSRLLDTLLFDTPDKFNRLLTIYPQTSSAEKQIILQRLLSLVDSDNSTAKDLLCQLVIHFDDPAAEEICKQRNLSPSSPTDKALYFFLSGQWDLYETFDFTHQWLVEAYSSAGPALRQKILSQARSSGQIEWLSGLSDSRPSVLLWELTPADWEKIAQYLLVNPFENLWSVLLPRAPLYWSAYLLNLLFEHTNYFEDDPDLKQIARLAAKCISKPLPIFEKAVLHSPAGNVSSMAVSPFGMEIGFGTLGSSIHFLNLNSLEWQKPIQSPNSPTRLIAYDPQASYLISAGGDHRLRIFRRQDNVLLKTLEGHKGQIRAIVFQSDGRLFYSAGFDGTIQSWHFPSGLAVHSPMPIGNEIFSLLIAPDNQLLLCAVADRACHFISTQSNHLVHSLSEFEDVPLTMAINRRQKLAVAARNQTIQQFSLSTFKPLTLPYPTSAVVNHLIYHPTLPMLFGIGLDGKIHIWHEADLRLLLTIEQHSQTASGLGITPDGNTLISSSTDGKVVIWDLQPFLMFFQPIHHDLHHWIERIGYWLKNNLQSPDIPWLDFAHHLLKWQARFDIQIDNAEPIQIGGYDILL